MPLSPPWFRHCLGLRRRPGNPAVRMKLATEVLAHLKKVPSSRKGSPFHLRTCSPLNLFRHSNTSYDRNDHAREVRPTPRSRIGSPSLRACQQLVERVAYLKSFVPLISPVEMAWDFLVMWCTASEDVVVCGGVLRTETYPALAVCRRMR